MVVYTASGSDYVSYADETTRVGTLSRSTWLAQVSSVTITLGGHQVGFRKKKSVESSLFDFLMKKQQLCHNKYELWPFMVATSLILST